MSSILTQVQETRSDKPSESSVLRRWSPTIPDGRATCSKGLEDPSNGSEGKVRLILEYEGTEYAGFQVQPRRLTVQGAVEEAFYRLTGERRRLAAASRTDAGVHARGQVVTFRTRARLAPDRFVSGLNHYLPTDVVVREAQQVSQAFDPRRHARSRIYRYTVLNRLTPSPLWRRFAYHLREPLDTELMQRVAVLLEGKRDLRAFTGEPGPGRNTLRRVDRAEVRRVGDLVLLEMEADGFLRQQVRRIAGALVQVGRGRLPAEAFGEMVYSPKPGAAAWALPPQGLCLIRVTYPRLETGMDNEDI